MTVVCGAECQEGEGGRWRRREGRVRESRGGFKVPPHPLGGAAQDTRERARRWHGGWKGGAVACAGCTCTRRVALALKCREGIEPRHGNGVEKGRAESGDAITSLRLLREGAAWHGTATWFKTVAMAPTKSSLRLPGPMLDDARLASPRFQKRGVSTWHDLQNSFRDGTIGPFDNSGGRTAFSPAYYESQYTSPVTDGLKYVWTCIRMSMRLLSLLHFL